MATEGRQARGGRSAGRKLRRWLVLACAGLIAGLLATPAAAYHIPGATYAGFASGGGSISFRVSNDGSSVENLTVNGPIQTEPCTMTGSRQYSQSTPLTNNSFDNGEVSGSFPSVQGAYGHYDIPVFGLPPCHVKGTWGAWTNAIPAGSRECKEAQAQVKKWKHRLNKAKKRGNEKKIKTLRGKWAAARDRRDHVC